jgi:AraC-like DNA-binding protein
MSSTLEWMYREYSAPGDLRDTVTCLWEKVADDTGSVIVPDGCIDLIWLGERELVVAGPDTGPRPLHAPAGFRSFGLRIRPGAAGSFLGMPASALVDQQPSAHDVFGPESRRLTELLATTSGPAAFGALAASARRRRPTADPVVSAAAGLLARPGATVQHVAAELGISERQLNRRTVAAVGYAPKLLARVLRLQRLTRMTGAGLAERSVRAGYASQAHMSDEVRALTGMSASRYLVRFVEDVPSREP